MRFIVYLILLGIMFISCNINRNEQPSGEMENSSEQLSVDIGSDTLFEKPAQEVKTSDTVEQENPAQKEFVPQLKAKVGDDNFNKTAEYHYKRGLVLFKLNKYEEGVLEFDSAIVMDPSNSDAYINRGRGLMELEQYEGARYDFEQAVNLDHRDTTCYLYLAMAYYQLGQYQEAVEANTEVIILAPRKAKGYYNRGIAYGLLKDYEKAIPDFNQAIALNPKYAEAFFNRGLAYYFSGDKKTACEDWELAKFYGNQKAIGAIDNYCK